jgi:hypothetical protein
MVMLTILGYTNIMQAVFLLLSFFDLRILITPLVSSNFDESKNILTVKER